MNSEDDVLVMWEDDPAFFEFDDSSSFLESCNGNQKSEPFSSKDEAFFRQIDEELDYAFALSLQTQYNDEVKENTNINAKKSVSKDAKPLSIVDEQWELIDPHPDIHALFLEYDNKFFFGKLKGVEVRWSPRMTLCAGVCSYEGRGGLCSIRLSVPLLKLRPRRDLVETLLHEMIHAYLFVTHNNKDREGHGPEFLSHMNRINKETGTRISVYHSFHDEVDLYRQHWWKCDGPCQKRRPFYGLVKRAMNRAPGPQDNWWSAHQASCGGKFNKIKEPDNYNKKKVAKRKHPSDSDSKGSDIRDFLKSTAVASSSSNNRNPAVKSVNIFDLKSVLSEEGNVSTVNDSKVLAKKNFIPFQGTGVKLGGSSATSVVQSGRSSLLITRDLSLPSGSSGKTLDMHSKTPKMPRFPNFSDDKNVQKGQSSSTTSCNANASKKLIQSPIEKFFSKNIVDVNSDKQEKVKSQLFQPNVSEKKQKIDASKVSCPVCFIIVKNEDINSHLDECLNN